MRPALRSLSTPPEREAVFERLAGGTRGGLQSFLVLTRHFFRRLFINDNSVFPDQMRERMISVLVLSALVTGHLANVVFFKYSLVADNGQSWVEKSYLLFFCMILMGLVAVLEWDAILLDRRDFSCLTPLPVTARTLFTAKLSSLMLLSGLFAAAMNAISMFVVFFYLPKWRSTDFLFGLRYMLAHTAAVLAAVLFTFFLAVFLIGLGKTILGYHRFARASVYIRGVLLAAFIVYLCSFLSDSMTFAPDFARFTDMKNLGAADLLRYPFLWFTGIYEVFLGTTDPDFIRLARAGFGALAAVMMAFFLVSTQGYRRYLKSFSAALSGRHRAACLQRLGERILNALLLRNPTERAVYLFFKATLQRSPPHRMRIAMYTAVGAGLIFVLIISGGPPREPGQGSLSLYAATGVGILFLLLGLRSAVRIPVAPESRWIFRMTEIPKSPAVRNAFFKAAVIQLVVPLTALIFAAYLFIWEWAAALHHALFGFGVAFLVLNILFFRQSIVPFACLSLAGKEKLQIYWLAYLITFVAYVRGVAEIELLISRDWNSLMVFLAAVALISLGLGKISRKISDRGGRLIFEEPPEPLMVRLGTESFSD